MVSRQEAPSRAGGRPEYKPTDEQRATVRQMRQQRPPVSTSAIAAALKISPNTLRKHFAAELAPSGANEPAQLELAGAHQPAISVPAAPTAPGPGRPEFEPSFRQREDVKLAKADNWSDERIARFIGVSRTTLLKHFALELEWGVDQLRMQVLRDVKAAAGKGNRAAAEMLLNLPGMIGGTSVLPVPDQDGETPEVADVGGSQKIALGKKEQARRDAQTAHQGTAWDRIVN